MTQEKKKEMIFVLLLNFRFSHIDLFLIDSTAPQISTCLKSMCIAQLFTHSYKFLLWSRHPQRLQARTNFTHKEAQLGQNIQMSISLSCPIHSHWESWEGCSGTMDCLTVVLSGSEVWHIKSESNFHANLDIHSLAILLVSPVKLFVEQISSQTVQWQQLHALCK